MFALVARNPPTYAVKTTAKKTVPRAWDKKRRMVDGFLSIWSSPLCCRLILNLKFCLKDLP